MALALAAFTLLGTAKAQVARYLFSQSSGTYTPITAGGGAATAIAGGWDDNVANVTIPSFTFNGVAYTALNINSNGYITFGATAPSSTTYSAISTSGSYSVVAPFARDLIDGDVGAQNPILQQTVGNEVVIQWTNAFRYSLGRIAGDVINFQIRLNTVSGTISFVYGTCSATATSVTHQVGMRGTATSDYNNRTSTTNWSTTLAGTANSSTMTTSATVMPPSGLTWTWTPSTCPIPTSPASSAITASGASVSWACASCTGTFIVEYGPAATFFIPGTGTTAAAGGTVITNAVSPQAISGLADNTQYRYFIRQDCGGGSISNSTASQTFTTLANCPAPTATAATGTTINSSNANWTCTGCTGNYIVEWGPAATFTTPGTGATPGANGTIINVPNGTLTAPISGLNFNTQYRYFVRQDCTGGGFGYGANSSGITFTTAIACPTVTSSAATGITITSANANWTCSGCTGNYIVEWGPAATFTTPGTGATPGANGTIINVPNGTLTAPISGLNFNTQYRYFVRQDCTGGGFGYGLNSAAQTFTTLIACPTVTSSAPSGITTTSANANWTCSGCTGNYIVEWGPAATFTTPGTGATAGTGGTIINVPNGTLTAPLSGLTQGSPYRYFVRQDCTGGGFGYGLNSSAQLFTTTCATAADVPYTESFEGTSGSAIPACMTRINVNGGTQWTTAAQTGTWTTGRAARYSYDTGGTLPADDWLFTQGINLVGGTSYRLSYLYGNDGGGTYQERMNIWYGSTASVAAMTNPLFDHTNIISTTAASNAVDFTPATSGVYYIGFHAYSIPDRDLLILDNVRVALSPNCIPPTGVTVSRTFTSATINWTNAPTGETYDYEVRSSGAAGSGATGLVASGSGLTAGPANATGLTANTNYSVYLRSHCNGGTETSDWSGATTFRTGYCTASSTTVDEKIANVMVADLNNPSSATTTYEDYTAVVGNVVASLNYPFAITVSPNYTTDQVLIWIDWNQNLDFEAGEQVFASALAGPYTGSFTVPPTALAGPTRMRVRLHDTYALNIDYPNTPNATPCGASTYGQVEDYTLNVIVSSCLPPTATVSGVTNTDAAASWAATGASSYEYELRTSGGPGSGLTGLVETATTGTTSLAFTGLTPNTNYSLYVRSLCSGGAEIGPWGPAVPFLTDCDATLIPFSENFNAVAIGSMPGCFRNETVSGNYWRVGSNITGQTSPAAISYFNAVQPKNNWFFTQGLQLTAGVAYRLTYYYQTNSTLFPERLEVKYGTANEIAGMTMLLKDHGTLTTSGGFTQVVDFEPPADGVYFIGFHAYSDAGRDYIMIDNITVDLAPPCAVPGGISFLNITPTSADLTWTTTTAESYDYEVRTSGAAGSGLTGLVMSGSVTAPPVALSPLDPATNYSVYVRGVCAGLPGDWSSANVLSTPCVTATVPYSENFNGVTTPALPACFSQEILSGNAWFTSSNVTASFPGIAAVHSYNSSQAANAWLYVKAVGLTGGTSYRLSYRYGDDNDDFYVEKMSVWYGSSPTAASMTNLLFDHTVLNNVATATKTIDFTPATSGTYYIGFRAYSAADQNYILLDDITLDLSPPCIEPSAVSALGTSTTSVTISWTGNGSGSYDYEVRTSGAAGSGPTGLAASGNVAGSPAVASGLTAATTYTVYVRGVCNGGVDLSGWVSGGTVTTPCDAVNVPYAQNFDAVTTPALPACISTQVIDGNAWKTANASGDFGLAYTGKVAYYGYNSTQDADSWLYTQSVNLTGGVSYRLSYRYGNDGGSTYLEQMAVWYGASANAGAMTNLLIDHGPISSTVNALQVMDFTPASSGTYVIGFHAYSDADQDVLIVDDIQLRVTPTCFPPTDLAVSGITLSNASLSWTDNASGSYDYEIRSSGAPGSGPVGLAASGNAPSGTPPVVVTGLAGTTTYTAYVRGSCSGGSDLSDWSAGVTFNTVCGTITAPFLQTFDALMAVPACWSTFSAGTETWGFATGTGGGTDPDYGAEDITDHTSGSGNFAWYDGSTPNDANVTLETPDVDISALTTAQVRFWVFSNNIDDGAQNTLTVAAYDGAAWVNIGTYAANAPNWVKVDVVVPNTIPDLTRFRIVANPSATGSAFYNDLLVDDFRVMEAPTCFPPTNVAISNIGQTSASLSWTNNTSPSYGYEVRTSGAPGSGPTGLALSGTAASGTPAVALSPLTGSTNYTVYVRGLCSGGSDPSEWTDALTFRTAQGCGTTFVDNGGPGGQQIPDDPVPGDYGVLENSVTTMCPNTPGDLIVVTFSAFSTEESYDALYVFNGNSTSAPKISSGNPAPSGTNNVYGAGGWWGSVAPNNLAPNVVRASNPSGCLTFAFTSDGSVTALGWEASVTCFTPNNTCATAAPVTCGNVYSGFTTSVAHSMPANSCPFNGAPSTGGQNWWTYTAAANEEVTLSTCGATDFDVRLSVFTGTACGDLACYSMVDNSPGCADGSAQLSFAATSGTTYYIAVHGAGAAEGNYQMAVSCAPLCTPATGNDACASATPITSAFAGTGVASTGDNGCAHNDAPTACSGADPVQGVWYSFNSGSHNHLLLTLADNSDNAVYTATTVNYALYSGTCSGLGASGEVSCATDAGGYASVLNVTPNTDYRLLIYNSGGVGVEGTFGLTLEHPAGNDAEVVAITYPAPGLFCSTVIAPTVTLRNNGDGPLNTVQFVYDIDGGTPVTYNWSGPALAFQASTSVTLPAITTTSGMHTLNIRTTLPNGAADETPANDAKSVALNISGESMVVSIRTDANGDQTTWQIYDSFFFTVAEGGPYTGQNNTTINTSICLPTTFGNCYSFYVFDSFGDGMCCANGNGYWELRTNSGAVLLRDRFAATPDGYQSPAAAPTDPGYVGHEFCLPAGPSNIMPDECGVFTNTLQSKVYCKSIPGVSQYQFEFTEPDGGFRRRIAVPRNWVKFSEMQTVPLVPGVIHFARVRVDQGAVGFADDHFGTGCEMALTSSLGCTSLIDDIGLPTHSCGVNKRFGASDKIWAYPTTGATQYRFRFTNAGEGFTRQISRPSYVCLLSWTDLPLQVGATYDVQVSILVNGVWGGFCGPTCQVTIVGPGGRPEARIADTAEGQLNMWPNPVGDGRVNLRIDGLTEEHQRISVELYDLFGKKVMTQGFENEGPVFNTILHLPNTVAKGVYLVNITINGRTQVQRLSVQ